jgi:hypothetical protein
MPLREVGTRATKRASLSRARFACVGHNGLFGTLLVGHRCELGRGKNG